MHLNQNQIRELLTILDNTHIIFIANQLGTGVLSRQEKALLTSFGIDWKKLPKGGKVDHAFKLGMLAEALGSTAIENMSYAQLQKYLESGKFLPLTEAEELALDSLNYQAYSDIKGLGNKIVGDFEDVIIEVDKKKRLDYEKVIAGSVEEALLKRQTTRELSSALKDKTKDYARNFDRIADYVLHDALDHGKAQQILKTSGSNALVYKSVYSDACKYCVGLYLKGGQGSEPKTFKLSTLISNGSNIGKKVAEWKAVIGPTHPHCKCETHKKPLDGEWDEDTGGYTGVKRQTYGVRRKSKAKIKINYT